MMPSTRRIVNRTQSLNPAVLQRQTVSDFVEKKRFSFWDISSFRRGIKKIKEFLFSPFSSLFDQRTYYSGQLKEEMWVQYAVNPKNHGGCYRHHGTILKFVGVSAAYIDEGSGKIVKRSVKRLRPVLNAIPA